MKILTPVLALYFFILFPAIHLAFPGNRFIYEYWPTLYFASALTFLLVLSHVNLQQLGFSDLSKKTLVTGIILGLLPVICVPALDILLVKAGLSNSELFAGAELRIPGEMGFETTLSGNFITALIVPFLDQIFLVGLVINNLLKKQRTGQAIIGGGLLYSLFHFKPSLANLFLGMMSTGLLRTTGSIIPSVLLHTGFAIAEILIVFHYPRLISVLVFLV